MLKQHPVSVLTSEVTFRRSSFCGDLNCVEVAAMADGDVLVRDTKDGDSGFVLRFTGQEWADFVNGVTAGEFTLAALACPLLSARGPSTCSASSAGPGRVDGHHSA